MSPPLGTGVFALAPLVAAAAEAPRPDADAIRRHLEGILARPEFSNRDPFWMFRWVKDFFEWLRSLQETSPLLFVLIVVGLILVLVALLAHIVWTLSRAFFVGRDATAGGEAAEQRARLSRTYHEEARRRAAAGEFTEAVRYLFLALVYRFDEDGRVLFQRAYTNREYLTLFADRPGVGDGLRVFVDTLDDHWYAERPTDARRYEECRALYDDLLRRG